MIFPATATRRSGTNRKVTPLPCRSIYSLGYVPPNFFNYGRARAMPHTTVMSPRDSAAWDGAPTLAHGTYASPATGSLTQHGGNVPTLLPAAPRQLRVPRARATQAAADQAAAWQRLGRLRRRRSSASSRARLRAPLQLLRRGFLQPPLRPRERDDGFLEGHRLSTKSITVRQEHVDETSILASAGVRAERSRARGLGGGGAKPSISIFDLPAFAPSNSCRHQPCGNLYRW